MVSPLSSVRRGRRGWALCPHTLTAIAGDVVVLGFRPAPLPFPWSASCAAGAAPWGAAPGSTPSVDEMNHFLPGLRGLSWPVTEHCQQALRQLEPPSSWCDLDSKSLLDTSVSVVPLALGERGLPGVEKPGTSSEWRWQRNISVGNKGSS